jgi:tRNA-splicing ligase RtcB
MKPSDLHAHGITDRRVAGAAMQCAIPLLREGAPVADVIAGIKAVVERPAAFADVPAWATLAAACGVARAEPVPFDVWGAHLIDPAAIEQMRAACSLPVAVKGALMPDAHLGYGLPIGGVLACDNAVIPYAVGVDIACRVRLSVLDVPARLLTDEADAIAAALEASTAFGINARLDADQPVRLGGRGRRPPGDRAPQGRHAGRARRPWRDPGHHGHAQLLISHRYTVHFRRHS